MAKKKSNMGLISFFLYPDTKEILGLIDYSKIHVDNCSAFCRKAIVAALGEIGINSVEDVLEKDLMRIE